MELNEIFSRIGNIEEKVYTLNQNKLAQSQKSLSRSRSKSIVNIEVMNKDLKALENRLQVKWTGNLSSTVEKLG